jgi:hypothetical protein
MAHGRPANGQPAVVAYLRVLSYAVAVLTVSGTGWAGSPCSPIRPW